MKTFTATELKNKTGQFIEAILKEHVAIQKSGREVAVVLPKEEYDRLIKLEDALWVARAKEAEAGGWASDEEVAALIARYHSA